MTSAIVGHAQDLLLYKLLSGLRRSRSAKYGTNVIFFNLRGARASNNTLVNILEEDRPKGEPFSGSGVPSRLSAPVNLKYFWELSRMGGV